MIIALYVLAAITALIMVAHLFLPLWDALAGPRDYTEETP